MTPAQAIILLDSLSNHRYGPMFTTMLGLGIRLGEARGLRWSDVHFDKCGGGTLTISAQMQRLNVQGTATTSTNGDTSNRKSYVLTTPKSNASRRTISLPGFVVEALHRQKELQAEWQLLACDKWRNDLGLVFTNLDGGVVDDARLRQRFTKVLAQVNLPKMRLHDLRHACASLLIDKNVHARVIQEILGHSSIAVTMGVYGHMMAGATQIAATAMDEVFTRQH